MGRKKIFKKRKGTTNKNKRTGIMGKVQTNVEERCANKSNLTEKTGDR